MRTRFDNANCSIARALEVLGDTWSMLIVREAFLGTRRFADFEARLGIAKNVLTARLQHLVDHQILTKVDAGQRGQRFEYELSDRGKDLLVVLTSLRQWGDRWLFKAGNEPVLMVDRKGQAVAPLRIHDQRGAPLRGRDIVLVPGPGADDETQARYLEMLKHAQESEA